MSTDLVVQNQMDLAQKLVASRLLPDSIKTPEQALAIMMKGKELGLLPMQAFAQINVIQGKPTLSPEGMLALIHQRFPKAVIKFVRLDRNGCEIHAARHAGEDLTKIAFEEEDAKSAGLLGKENWRKYPRAMYRSRAVAEMARTIFPDAIAGASYTPEELGARVDEDGRMVSANIVSLEETHFDSSSAVHRSRVVEIARGLEGITRDGVLRLCDAVHGVELTALDAEVRKAWTTKPWEDMQS